MLHNTPHEISLKDMVAEGAETTASGKDFWDWVNHFGDLAQQTANTTGAEDGTTAQVESDTMPMADEETIPAETGNMATATSAPQPSAYQSLAETIKQLTAPEQHAADSAPVAAAVADDISLTEAAKGYSAPAQSTHSAGADQSAVAYTKSYLQSLAAPVPTYGPSPTGKEDTAPQADMPAAALYNIHAGQQELSPAQPANSNNDVLPDATPGSSHDYPIIDPHTSMPATDNGQGSNNNGGNADNPVWDNNITGEPHHAINEDIGSGATQNGLLTKNIPPGNDTQADAPAGRTNAANSGHKITNNNISVSGSLLHGPKHTQQQSKHNVPDIKKLLTEILMAAVSDSEII